MSLKFHSLSITEANLSLPLYSFILQIFVEKFILGPFLG